MLLINRFYCYYFIIITIIIITIIIITITIIMTIFSCEASLNNVKCQKVFS